jgi:hypothetical protein
VFRAVLSVTSLCRKFEFKYAGDKPEEVLMSVTAHPKFGVPLRVKHRQLATAAADGAAAGL